MYIKLSIHVHLLAVFFLFNNLDSHFFFDITNNRNIQLNGIITYIYLLFLGNINVKMSEEPANNFVFSNNLAYIC